jgi:hypothetical protein
MGAPRREVSEGPIDATVQQAHVPRHRVTGDEVSMQTSRVGCGVLTCDP